VYSRNLENEEAKARYRALKNTTTVGCNARETNKQTPFHTQGVNEQILQNLSHVGQGEQY
jgi:hypothetical protein